MVFGIVKSFFEGFLSDPDARRASACAEQEQRSQLSKQQIDGMVENSFPASDPPSTY